MQTELSNTTTTTKMIITTFASKICYAPATVNDAHVNVLRWFSKKGFLCVLRRGGPISPVQKEVLSFTRPFHGQLS